MMQLHWIAVLALITGIISSGGELVFPDRPGVMYSQVNKTIILSCELTFPSDETLELVTWYQNTTYICIKGNDGKVKYRDPSLEKKFMMVNNNSLLVITVRLDDMGNYSCRKDFKKLVNGSTVFLTDSRSIDLIVQDVPSPPGVPIVTNVNARDIVVSWQKSMQDNNSPITNYIINVKRALDGWENARVLLVSFDTLSIVVKELLPNNAYQIHVLAKNALGNSIPSRASEIFMTRNAIPGLPPLNLRANSPDSRIIKLEWDLIPDDYINGMAKGYRIEYQRIDNGNVYALSIENPQATEAVIKDLNPYTTYNVSVQLDNDVGSGPAAVITLRTAEGVPDKPRITHCSEIKSTSFVVNWEVPIVKYGVLKNYQLQWEHNNTYKTRIISGHLTQPMSAHVTGLEPYLWYVLRVRAESGGGYGDYSDEYPVLTDIVGPSSPMIMNVTVLSPNAIFLRWQTPQNYYKKIDSYFIYYQMNNVGESSKFMVPGTDSQTIITDLPTNNKYKVKVAGVTTTIYLAMPVVGEYSNEVEFSLEGPAAMASVNVMSAGMIAGIIVILVVVVVMVLFFIGYRSIKCRRSLYYLAVPTHMHSSQNVIVLPPSTLDEDTKYAEIPVANFLQHVRTMHANSDDGFAVEFIDITNRTYQDLSSDCSYLTENKAKNRYVNISAFDHSRVVLQPVPGKLWSSDYINANFIDGYKKPCAYIATQGPLPHTFADFWRMVWDQGSIVIVMITNLVERGRPKCDMYWPEEGSETYGCITVKHLNTFTRAHYTVRMFSLKISKNKKMLTSERIVYQYHYTEWPDHGVPEFTLPVLKFIQKSSSENPPGAGPVIIHCSAGVGRTGTYILIDAMIKQIKDKATVNIAAFLLHIRRQRNFLVQTEEQYMLVHDAIAEYILTHGDTEIKENDISNYIHELTHQTNGEIAPLDIQYHLVTNFSPKPDDTFHALKSVNLSKNRSLDMIPLSIKRVLLRAKPGVDGSDYINATYLQGYNKTDEFIITQHPLEQTVEDFWRMVWDQNSSVIIQLSQIDDNEFKNFWPAKDQCINIGCFKLMFREEDDTRQYKIRSFLLQSNQDDYILMTRILTPNAAWLDHQHPFDLVDEVSSLHKQNDIGPVIVVDKYGGVEAATFCALWSIRDQLQNDKTINVYQLTKLYHLKRARCIGSKENYLFLHHAAESLIKEWQERNSRKSSPSSVRLHLGSQHRNGTMSNSVTINSKAETNV